MFKTLCFILIHLTLMAKVPKRIILSDKKKLFIYSNGEVDKGNEFATVWNYDSSEDLSFEHFSKNHETKKEVDKRDIYIERDSGKMQKFFVAQYDHEAQKVLRDKNYDPFRFSSFGAKVLK